MTQLFMFHSLIIKRKKYEHLSFLSAIRTGAWADSKDIKKHIKELGIG